MSQRVGEGLGDQLAVAEEERAGVNRPRDRQAVGSVSRGDGGERPAQIGASLAGVRIPEPILDVVEPRRCVID